MYVRRDQAIKRHQKQHKPENGVDSLDRKLGCSKQQWEKRDMARHSQRPESSEVPTVPERYQAERDDHYEDRLLVDVPSKEERRIAAKGYGPDEVLPSGLYEQTQQERLAKISSESNTGKRVTHDL